MNWRESLIKAPAVPIALAATAGILLDRAFSLPDAAMLAVAVVGCCMWLVAPRMWIAGAALTVVAAGGLHHHLHLHSFSADDIGNLVNKEDDSPGPDEHRLVHLAGQVVDEPVIDRTQLDDPLRSYRGAPPAHLVLDVESLFTEAGTRSASGRLAVFAEGDLPDLHAGQRVEAVGWLAQPEGPSNPGERDRQSELLDQGIRAVLTVRGSPSSINPIPTTNGWSFRAALSHARVWARRQLTNPMSAPLDGVAAALLLGETAAMERTELEPYLRTGTIHVLAISGLHLTVLAGFIGVVLRILFVPKRITAIIIIGAIVLYTALVGGRPPVLRATVMVAVVCGAILVSRPARPLNSFALAWLIVLAINPTSLADPGFQFSFFCVALLIWGGHRWLHSDAVDPLQRLIEESRPWPHRIGRQARKLILIAYVVNLVLGIAVLPLTARHFHTVPLAGLIIGPPVVLLSSVALIAGFVQLSFALVSSALASLVATVTQASLGCMAWLVKLGDRLPGSHIYVGMIPDWWLIGFLTFVAALLWLPVISRRPIVASLTGLIWLCIGLGVTWHRPAPDGLRATFLAVGHGGCTVIETPDNRVILFDAGAMSGPNVTRRIIAPFLWYRGIRAIDEVFLSHADLDHFNGLPALIERFHVGRVSWNPSFSAKPTPGVQEVIKAITWSNIPIRAVMAGDSLVAGDVLFDVLHPTPDGPPGPENFRSMVLAVRHIGRTIVLTGDLDGEGRWQLLGRGRESADILMAPHHGGTSANPPELAAWFRPKVVIACQGQADRTDAARKIYTDAGCHFLGTWPHGAVTILQDRDGLRYETFRTRLQLPLPHTLAADDR